MLLLLLIPLKDTRPGGAQAAYSHALKLFQHGRLADSQRDAERGYKQFKFSDPEWAGELQLLEAEAMVWRGMYDDALRVLAAFRGSGNPEDEVRQLAIESVIDTHQQEYGAAEKNIAQAEKICLGGDYAVCGDVFRARGILAGKRGKFSEARQSLLKSYAFAKAHHDQLLEASASLNLGWAALQTDHFDEALDWSMTAYRAGIELGAEDTVQIASGNLGWAYYRLGDTERALTLFLEAEKISTRIGNVRMELKWIATAGYVYRDTGDLTRAAQAYRRTLALARQIDSKEDIVNALEDLAQISVEAGKLDEAGAYVQEVASTQSSGGNPLSTYLTLTQGMLASARREDQKAETIFRTIDEDKASQISMRLGAEHELARLFELEGKTQAADLMYQRALTSFESARAQLKSEGSRLPFLANAARIYDDYIQFLVAQGKPEEALLAADQSRARTLAQGLGLAGNTHPFRPTALEPRSVARKAGATLLFYWLGERQSYLWAITPDRLALFNLPAERELAPIIERYRAALQESQGAMEVTSEDGRALYKSLVTPAVKLIRPNTPVMILADGVLSQLNFETLLAPGPSPFIEPAPRSVPGSASNSSAHYWIEDATVVSAPSLAMLAGEEPVRGNERGLLVLGNPVPASQEFPSLPYFGLEMTQIERHFAANNQTVFTGQLASPAVYLSSDPARYAYIHFVAHAVASRADPLDSAIILSGAGAGGDSFKLYARDIMQHPIHARLVTISACYGSGTRAYAGEGMVGLAWAFLRAGAHNTIGALWEVSDDSTPRLMDTLYKGLAEGQTPATALRRGKLDLLHSQGRFSSPFYWAPFQIYTR